MALPGRVPRGDYLSFNIFNRGMKVHDFEMFGKKTPALKPGGHAHLFVSARGAETSLREHARQEQGIPRSRHRLLIDRRSLRRLDSDEAERALRACARSASNGAQSEKTVSRSRLPETTGPLTIRATYCLPFTL